MTIQEQMQTIMEVDMLLAIQVDNCKTDKGRDALKAHRTAMAEIMKSLQALNGIKEAFRAVLEME